MFFRRFFRFAFITILIVGMFGLLGSAAYHSGWSQGYVTAQTADGVPAASPGFGFLGGNFSFFGWLLAAFFMFWIFLFFIGSLFKLLFWRGRRRHRRWRHWNGRHHKGQHRDWSDKFKDFPGQRPPWYDDSDGEPVMKA